jgi:hypothetical protein
LSGQKRVTPLWLVQVDPDIPVTDAMKDPSIHEAPEQLLREVTDDHAVLKQN